MTVIVPTTRERMVLPAAVRSLPLTLTHMVGDEGRLQQDRPFRNQWRGRRALC